MGRRQNHYDLRPSTATSEIPWALGPNPRWIGTCADRRIQSTIRFPQVIVKLMVSKFVILGVLAGFLFLVIRFPATFIIGTAIIVRLLTEA